MYLPEAFQKKMKAILGEEYDDFLAGFEKPRHYGLRVNTAKITVEEFKELVPFHLTQIPWVENGFYYEEEDAPTRHPYYYAGLYYIQEPSAMTTASRLPVGPGERVLDLCAAPGGKATELGAKLFGEGLLVANDISASRVKALLKNIEVMGIPNSFLLNEVPAKIAEQFPAYFDKILVDAPCSGEGMFRKNPEAARVWSEEKPPECAKMQREIVKQAISMLKPGGMMIYSTCTFSPEENEQIIAWVLREFPEVQLIPMKGYEGFSEGRPDLADGNPERALKGGKYILNFVFVSPQFPKTYWNFCDRLKHNGVNVLGIGDSGYDETNVNLIPSISSSLTYCLMIEFLGSVRIARSASRSRGLR